MILERFDMTRVFKRCGWLICLLLTVSVGCETTDYEPLLMKKKLKDLETEIDDLQKQVNELKSGSASERNSAATDNVPEKGTVESPVVEEAVGLSADAEKVIRDELENGEAFFLLNSDGFAIEADLSEYRDANAALSKIDDFRSLATLTLDGTKTDSQTFKTLAGFSALSKLTIDRSSPSAEDFAQLKGLKNLKYLGLKLATLTDEGIEVLSEFPVLEQIRCGQTRIGDAELTHLAKLKTLKAIDLTDCNRVTVEGVRTLSNCPNLEFLRVWGPSIGDDSLQVIGKMKSLRVLGLQDTKISDEGFKYLADLDLQDIHLFRTLIGDETLRVIAEMPNVTALNLRDSLISDQGIEYLTKLTKLEKLDVSECNAPGITDASGEYFGKMKSLKQLIVWKTKFTDAGVQPLTTLPNLTYLNLDDTGVGDEGVALLAEMPQLTWLHLGSTSITDQSADVLKGLTNLKFLSITNTGITIDIAYEIDDVLTPKGCNLLF